MIHELFAGVCHQLPARTLAVAGVFLPACARCAGFYLGLALTFIYYLVPATAPGRFLRHPSRSAGTAAALGLLPFFVDMALALWAPRFALGNDGRFAVSLVAGWGTWVLLAGVASRLRWGPAPERRLTLGRAGASMALLLVPAILSVTPYRWAAAFLTAGILTGALVFYGTLSYLPLALLLHKKHARRRWQTLIAGALAAVAWAEMRWGYGLYEKAARIVTALR